MYIYEYKYSKCMYIYLCKYIFTFVYMYSHKYTHACAYFAVTSSLPLLRRLDVYIYVCIRVHAYTDVRTCMYI